MLSPREIADYVHGQATTPEKQQFTFGNVKKIGDTLTMRWPASTDIIADEGKRAGKFSLTPKANKVTATISRVRIRTSAKIRAARTNILLILLFILLSALMFVLESRQALASQSSDDRTLLPEWKSLTQAPGS